MVEFLLNPEYLQSFATLLMLLSLIAALSYGSVTHLQAIHSISACHVSTITIVCLIGVYD